MNRWTRLLTMPLLVAGGYLLVSLSWIYFSDRLVINLAGGDPELLAAFQSWKGMGFVAMSGVFLGVVLSLWNMHRLRLEQRYTRILESLPGAVVVHRDYRLLYANRAARELYGMGDDYVGLWGFKLVHPDEHERLLKRTVHLLDSGLPLEPSEYRHMTLDGQEIEVEVTAAVADFDGEPAVHAYIRDLSARRRAERTARRIITRFESFAEHSPAGLAIVTVDGEAEYSSPVWQRLFGDWLPRLQEAGSLDSGPAVSIERTGQGREMMLWQFRLRDTDDRQRPMIGLIALDMTERFDAERRVSRMHMQRNEDYQRVSSEMDEFLHAITHDLRTPLRAMTGFSDALVQDYGDSLDETARHYLEHLHDAAHNMSKMIEGLLELSRLGRAQMQTGKVDLAHLAREVVAELREVAPRDGVEVRIHDVPPVYGDPGMLKTALRHLFDNAWKFTRGETGALIEFEGKGTGAGTVFSVRDNGAGFDMAYAHELFLPFQRVHGTDEFEGIGLGLAVVQRVVTRHGGKAWAEAEPGKGATIHFTLGEVPDG